MIFFSSAAKGGFKAEFFSTCHRAVSFLAPRFGLAPFCIAFIVSVHQKLSVYPSAQDFACQTKSVLYRELPDLCGLAPKLIRNARQVNAYLQLFNMSAKSKQKMIGIVTGNTEYGFTGSICPEPLPESALK